MSGRVGAILVAAGASRRMGFDKLWSPLAGRLVVSYALEALASHAAIDELALVVASNRRTEARRLAAQIAPEAAICEGGADRRDSVAAGLAALGRVDWVLVHDAARPFVDAGLIERGLVAALATGAAIAAIPANDTIKRVAGQEVVDTLPRAELWQVQTPQVFRFDVLEAALAVLDRDATDEATLVERLGGKVRVFAGSGLNWKITTPADLELAEALLALRLRGESIRPERAGSLPTSGTPGGAR